MGAPGTHAGVPKTICGVPGTLMGVQGTFKGATRTSWGDPGTPEAYQGRSGALPRGGGCREGRGGAGGLVWAPCTRARASLGRPGASPGRPGASQGRIGAAQGRHVALPRGGERWESGLGESGEGFGTLYAHEVR